MVDINNRDEFFKRLQNLNADALPEFGKLSAQHMVEHLSSTVMIANGKIPAEIHGPKEQADLLKQALIYTDMEFPMHFRAPMMGEDPPDLELKDLAAAIGHLKKELDDFDKFFAEDESRTTINPVLGALNKHEWTVFHNKHFAHHLKQFNLLQKF